MASVVKANHTQPNETDKEDFKTIEGGGPKMVEE